MCKSFPGLCCAPFVRTPWGTTCMFEPRASVGGWPKVMGETLTADLEGLHPIHLLKRSVSLGFLSSAQSTLESLPTCTSSPIPCPPLKDFLQSHFPHLKEASDFYLSSLVFIASLSFYLAWAPLPDPFRLIIVQAVIPIASWPVGSRLWSSCGGSHLTLFYPQHLGT